MLRDPCIVATDIYRERTQHVRRFSNDHYSRKVLGRHSQWQRGLRRRCAAERLLGSCIRIPRGARMFVLHSVCVVR
jgi:hypothetical protein